MNKDDLMREAFLTAHTQLQDHRNQKIDYLQREKKERSWKDDNHPTRLHSDERHHSKVLKELYDKHGWGGEKD